MTIVPSLACELKMELGEGPLWSPEEQALWFVDIKRGRLHQFNPASGECETHEVAGSPSFVMPVDGGGLLVGSGNKLFRFDGGVMSPPLLELDMPAHNRTNDATVDGQGRLWFGTMDNDEQVPTGTLHCLGRGELMVTAWHAVVTNGPAVSSDDSCLYHVDSGQRAIWRIAMGDGGLAATGEIFVKFDEAEGYPDGVVVDGEDCLWVALWDGWGVRRYAPDGSLLLHVEMPCARPTKIALGGADLRTAFVTTARVGLDEKTLADQPWAGSLLSFPAPAPGRLVPPVILNGQRASPHDAS